MKSHFSIVIWMYSNFNVNENACFAGGINLLIMKRFIFWKSFHNYGWHILRNPIIKSIHVEKTTFLADVVKAGMKVAECMLLMSFFVYVYYTYIDVDYFEIKLSRQLELMAASADKLALNQIKKNWWFVLSPYFQSAITLILYLYLALLRFYYYLFY